MRNLLFILLLSLVTCNITYSSDLDSALNRIQKCVDFYVEKDTFSFKVQQGVFYGSNSELFGSKTGKIVKAGNFFYQNQIGMVQIHNDQNSIIIDKESKVFMVSKRDSVLNIGALVFDADSLRASISRCEKLRENNDKISYRFYFSNNTASKIDFTFYKSDSRLYKIKVHYRELIDFGDGPKKVIAQTKYYSYSTSISNLDALFSSNTYFKKEGDKITAKSPYSNFKTLFKL